MRWRPRMSGGRLRLAALATAVVLAAGGGSAIGWAATHQQTAPQPSAAAAGTLDPSAQAVSPSGPSRSPSPSRVGPGVSAPPTRGPLLTRSIPTAITIPAVGVHSVLRPIGLDPDGALAVPQPGPYYNQAAWYTGSPTPGQLGPAIIEGHIDSAADGPSVFFRLGAAHPGDRIYITRADGHVATFVINAVRRYPKDQFPTATVYGNTDHAALRLLTCGGSFDQASGHYRDNTVVFAHLIGSQPANAPTPAT